MNKERKQTMWSRQRIEQLIELYKKHECLWNPYNEFYKNKAKRNKAVEIICNTLVLPKADFAKKIHNLRNQFNNELKKYEQLLQEAEEEDGNRSNTSFRCRWAHFQSLMFLKNVIAPRPGNNNTTSMRIRLESNANNSSSALIPDEIYIEETQVGDDDDNDDVAAFEGIEQELIAENDGFPNSTSKSSKEEKRTVITVHDSKGTPTKFFTRLHASTPLTKPMANREVKTISPQLQSEGAVIEFESNSICNTVTEKRTPILSNRDREIKIEEVRDQWTAFGEFVANELRNYNSDLSRRKLKRKIMQAMLEIDEDDDLTARGPLI